jgi:hypothetical protein
MRGPLRAADGQPAVAQSGARAGWVCRLTARHGGTRRAVPWATLGRQEMRAAWLAMGSNALVGMSQLGGSLSRRLAYATPHATRAPSHIRSPCPRPRSRSAANGKARMAAAGDDEVTLVSSEGDRFKVAKRVAQMSELVKTMTEEPGACAYEP